MNSFITHFQNIVDRYPNQLAVVAGHKDAWTYSQLYTKAGQLSETLKKQGVGPGSLIGIHLSKSADYVIALLATWMAEAAFIPIDPSLPHARQQYYMTQAKPNGVIHPSLDIEFHHPKKRYDPNLAYILFTSGSTGQPKGVMIPHQGIVNFIEQQIDMFQMDQTSRMLWYLSIQFDASISDLGTTLLSGGTLYLFEEDRLELTLQLASTLEKHRITHIDIPPSLLSMLDIAKMPNTLKTIIIGGETCAIGTVRQWAEKYRVINVYGPTEATVCTSMIHCTEHFVYASIGKPIKNVHYLILDQHQHESSQGELYISGHGLALGYLNNKTLSQSKFVTVNNVNYYRTGDWVKRNSSGNYVYLGRIDRQEKIHGRLIEPDEIEAALYQHPHVTGAAVTIYKANHRKQILALVTTKAMTTSSLLNYFLRSLLPSWMIPHRILIVDSLPKNTSGKIDYSFIKRMDLNSTNIEPRQDDINPIARKLQQLFQEVLNLPYLPGLHDDFFCILGITSLDILHLTVRLEFAGYPVSIELLRHLPTLYDLSTWIQQKQSFHDAMPTDVLKKEASGILHTQVNRSDSNGIFLTGATGFLGSHLLEELLNTTPHNITCLIRANSRKEASAKLHQVVKHYGMAINPDSPRIQIVLGDVALPQLGLADTDWESLCNNIGRIIHCAAEVNMTKTFAELKAVNLEGTKEIAKLAMTTSKKHLTYISTLSVFVATDRNTGVCTEEDTLEATQVVYGGYAQSKWAADYFLRHSQLDVSIFRLGLITGHSLKGYCSSQDAFVLFTKGIKEICAIPKLSKPLYVDATPVDYAARAIIQLTFNAPSGCYHIANQKGFSLSMILRALGKQGLSPQEESAKHWLTNHPTSTAYLALCRLFSHQETVFTRFRSMDLFQATDVEFAQKNTLKYLAKSNICCPIADEKLLDNYMQWILNAT